MKISRKTILSLIIAGTSLCSGAQTQQENKITQAVLDVYNQELKENPEDYNVLFRRAHLYYGHNQYLRALSDIDDAIRFTPQSDKDLLSQEYSLRANIYLMSDETEKALYDISKAYEYDPTSYSLLYQKANIEFQLGNYTAAKEDFRKLQRLHNRSLESLIGLARVAVKENNLGLANEYVDQAVALYPAESDAYIRRASVRSLIGNNTGAVDDLLLALSIDRNNSKAISEIVRMSNIDYNAVISGLSNAITQAPEVGMFYYIRAIIAQAHFHYMAAIADFNTIIDKKLYNYHGIHASLAECHYSLCNYKEALNEINYAIGATADNANYYITNSKIHLAMGDDIVAMEYATLASVKLPDSNKAIIQKALCSEAVGNFKEASEYYGEAIINDAEEPTNYIARGWILDKKMNKNSEGEMFLTRVLELKHDESDIRSLKGFALAALGRNEEASEWLEKVTSDAVKTDVDGSVHYLAACLYSQLGDLDKALEMIDQSLQKGYSNLYNLTTENTANINISPLRKDERFTSLLDKYQFLFK